MLSLLANAPALVPSWDGLCASRHQDFLTEHWQKRPLLIRGLLSPEEVEALCPLTPDELVDLAGDADVCSRLVLETGGAQPWELRHGPFEPDVLDLMGGGPCSLLVQQVDQLVPEVGRRRERFATPTPMDGGSSAMAATSGLSKCSERLEPLRCPSSDNVVESPLGKH